MSPYNETLKSLSECLLSDGFLPEAARSEAAAVSSHFLQNPQGAIPLLSAAGCAALAKMLTSGEEVLSCAEAGVETTSLHIDDLFGELPYPPPNKWDFTFIDLFAGIGGFRQAFQSAGGKCIFSSEWNPHAQKTYAANYGEVPYGDIRLIPKEQIPAHDVLCAGFPCQPFSLAGVSKNNSLGRKHGFEDETRGTLFFEIKEILRLKRPKAFMLENVKNLLSHDKGRTFEVIRRSLVDELGYVIKFKVVNGGAWVPQHRERIYILGFDPEQLDINEKEIEVPEKPSTGYKYPRLSSIIKPELSGYTLGAGTWAALERHKAYHEQKGNGFGYGLLTLPLAPDAVTRTISARYHKDGAEILIEQKGDRPRKLSVEEAMQLQGYDPRKFIFPVSATQAYMQIGNSVVVPAVEASAHVIAGILKERAK